MSDNGQGTTTQGQSIPTAPFEKMFANDKGMPGRNELQSTIQDRSASSAKYKVGDEVLHNESKYFVISATRTQAGRYLYDIERRVTLAAIGVTENMLSPVDEAAQ